MAISKVIFNGVTQLDVSGTTATANKILEGFGVIGANGRQITGNFDPTVGTITQDENGYLVIDDGTKQAALNLIASATPIPSVRNFFYALQTGTLEYGEVTFANVPTSFIDVFTLQTIQAPPQGILFIDKNFYEGITTLDHNTSEGLSFAWFDKAFVNPARNSTAELIYGSFRMMVNQTGTTGTAVGGLGYTIFDGSTQSYRARFKFVDQTLQVRADYNNNAQYTFFKRNRPYIWIAY